MEKEVQVAELKKDLERAETELQNSNVAVQRQQAEVNREDAAFVRLESDLTEIGEKLTQMRERRMTLETSVATLDQEYQASRSGIEDRQKTVTSLQIESSTSQKDVESFQQRFELLSRSLGEIEEQVSKMSSESDRSHESLTVNQVLVEQKKIELRMPLQKRRRLPASSALRDSFEQVQTRTRAQESQVNETHHGYHQLQARMNEATLRLEQVRMKEQYLVDQMNERYMIDLRLRASEFGSAEIDVVAMEAEVVELKD